MPQFTIFVDRLEDSPELRNHFQSTLGPYHHDPHYDHHEHQHHHKQPDYEFDYQEYFEKLYNTEVSSQTQTPETTTSTSTTTTTTTTTSTSTTTRSSTTITFLSFDKVTNSRTNKTSHHHLIETFKNKVLVNSQEIHDDNNGDKDYVYDLVNNEKIIIEDAVGNSSEILRNLSLHLPDTINSNSSAELSSGFLRCGETDSICKAFQVLLFFAGMSIVIIFFALYFELTPRNCARKLQSSDRVIL